MRFDHNTLMFAHIAFPNEHSPNTLELTTKYDAWSSVIQASIVPFLVTHKNALTREIWEASLVSDYVIPCRYFFEGRSFWIWIGPMGGIQTKPITWAEYCLRSREPLQAMWCCVQSGNKGFSRAYIDSLSGHACGLFLFWEIRNGREWEKCSRGLTFSLRVKEYALLYKNLKIYWLRFFLFLLLLKCLYFVKSHKTPSQKFHRDCC